MYYAHLIVSIWESVSCTHGPTVYDLWFSIWSLDYKVEINWLDLTLTVPTNSISIVAGNAHCTTNVSGAVQENVVIMMTCSVTYSGNWAPVMRWFNSSHNFTDDSITSTTSDTTITSQLTITASAALRGSHIACVTYFTEPSTPLSTTATNVLSYKDMWTSPKLNVTALCKYILLADSPYRWCSMNWKSSILLRI